MSSNTSEDASGLLDVLQHSYAGSGVLIRVLECSLPCLSSASWSIGGFGAPCIVHELERKLAPASLLRWDLPVSIFMNGRCLKTTTVGTHVTAAGVGWLLCDRLGGRSLLRTIGRASTKEKGKSNTGRGWTEETGRNARQSERRISGVAFAHDAWTPKHTEVRLPSRIKFRLFPCSTARESGKYVEARLMSTLFRSREAAIALDTDSAYLRGFINSSWNCYWPHPGWEHAFSDQKAFAVRLAKHQLKGDVPTRPAVMPAQAEAPAATDLHSNDLQWRGGLPGTFGAVYNQVHTSYSPRDVCGVFYVNSSGGQLSGEQGSAARALQLAHLAAQIASSMRGGERLPVLQFHVGADSVEPLRLVKRLARGRTSANIRDFFARSD